MEQVVALDQAPDLGVVLEFIEADAAGCIQDLPFGKSNELTALGKPI